MEIDKGCFPMSIPFIFNLELLSMAFTPRLFSFVLAFFVMGKHLGLCTVFIKEAL